MNFDCQNSSPLRKLFLSISCEMTYRKIMLTWFVAHFKRRKGALFLSQDRFPVACGIWFLIYSKPVLSPVHSDGALEGNKALQGEGLTGWKSVGEGSVSVREAQTEMSEL